MPQNEEVIDATNELAPEEAAKNIEVAKEKNVPPDSFAEMKKEFAEADEEPIRTSKPVADVMRKSNQHTAVIKEDIDKLNWAERNWEFAKLGFQGSDINAKLSNLQYRRALGEELSVEERFEVANLNDELKRLNGGREDYGYSFTESLPAEIATGIYDFGRMVGDSYDEVLLGAGVGMGGGAIIGLASANPFGVLAGAIYGGQAGATVGLTVGLTKSAYEQTVGQVYNDLSFVIPETRDLPEVTKRQISIGAGLASGAIAFVPAGAIVRNTPFLKRAVNPRGFVKWMMTAEGGAVRQAITAMGRQALAEGGEEGAQEIIQSMATQIGKDWDGSQEGFLKGVRNTLSDPEVWKQAGKSAVVGAAVGGAIQGGLSTVDTVVRTEAPRTDLQIDPEIEPTQVTTRAKGVRAIQLKQALDRAVQLTKDTTTRQMLPEAMDEIRKKIYDDAGTGGIWVDKEELSAWADSDEKAAVARELIGPDGIAAAELNSPLRVEAHKFLKIAEDNPEITRLVKADPTGPSFMSFWTEMQQAGKRRKEIIESMPGEVQVSDVVGVKAELEKELSTVAKRIDQLKDRRLEIEKSIIANEVTTEQVSDERVNIEQELTALTEQRGKLTGSIDNFEDIELRERRIRDEDIYGEEPYLEQQTFTKDMEEVLSPKEILNLNEAETTARVEVADAIQADVDKETEKVIDLKARFKTMFDEQMVKDQNETAPKVVLVEDFLDNSRVVDPAQLTDAQAKRMKKDLPVHSMDVTKLPERLQNKYADDPVLKFRKVFVKDGMDPEEVATLYNMESVEELLETLSKTPTTEEKLANETADLEEDLRIQLQSQRGEIEKSKMAKAYDNMTKVHLKSAKILRDKYWPSFRKGIERIALSIPKLEKQLQKRAKDTIGATKVIDLDINRWSVAERRSNRISIQEYNKGNLEEGFRQKQNAALSAQLQKETRIANSKVNKAFNFITKLSTERYERQLKDAGKTYFEAARYILDVFNFHPSQKGKGDPKQFQKYVKEMIEKGEGDQSISREQLRLLDVTEDATELTVDQILFLEDQLRKVFKKAQLKNKLIRKDEVRSVEMIEDVAHEEALKHSNYDEGRASEQQGEVPLGLRLSEGFNRLETQVNNNQFMVLELDDGVTNGFWANLLHDPIKGVGQYEGTTGLVADAKLRGEYGQRFKKMIKKHFKSMTEWKNYSVDVVTIPEFAQLDAFKASKGKVTKHELLMILANMGNAENRAYIENYGMDAETMRTILERELGERDFDFVQDAFWSALSTLAPRLDAVSKSVNGVELDFVKAEPFTAFGKTYQGGYFPIMLSRGGAIVDTLIETSLSELGRNPLDPSTNSTYQPSYEGVVRSPHTKERKGSDYLLDLNMERYAVVFDDMIYDITMREPIRDVMTLVKRPSIRKDMTSILGKYKYNAFVNNIAESTRSASATRTQVHHDQNKMFMGITGNIESSFTAAYIAFNPKSLLMSTLAIPQITLRMGPKNFSKYMGKMAGRMMLETGKLNLKYFKEVYALATEIDPSLQNQRQGIEDFSRSAIDKVTQKKRVIKGPKPVRRAYNNLRRLQEAAYDVGLSTFFGTADTMIKVMVTASVYDMYVNGDAKGHDYDSVRKNKTPEEINRDAKAFTAQFLDGTTMRAAQYDKAALQKMSGGRLFTKFWNETRSQLNNYINAGRDVRRDAKKMVSAAKAGNDIESRLAFQGAAGAAGNILLAMLISKALYNMAQYGTAFLVPNDDEDPYEQDGDFAGYLAHSIVEDPVGLAADTIGSTVPGVRDILFVTGVDSRTAVPRYNVNIPLLAAGTDIATALRTPGELAIMTEDGLTLWEAMGELDDKELKGFLAGTSYLVGGVPGVNQVTKLRALMEEEEIELPNMNFINQNFLDNLDNFIEEHETPEARFNRLMRKREGKETVEDALVEEVSQYRDTLRPIPKGDVLTQDGYEIIKHAESNGRWNASPSTSGAFGVYQFTEGTWKRVMATPEGKAAGLTPQGRFQKNGRQQEKAMKILTKYNVTQMRRQKVPINIESIYFAHHFSPRHAAAVYNVDDKKKLPKSLLSPAVLKANPKLVKDKVKTAGDMKKYIRGALARGEKSLTKLGR